MDFLKQKVLLSALLVLLCLIAFGEVRHAQFLNFDDVPYVTDNPRVRRGLSLEGLRWALTTVHASNWHPLTWLSHMLDCQLFGMQAGAHHVVNLIFHAANTLLLFLGLLRLTSAPGASFLAAALFAVHPLRVESVAWVAERKDVLSTFFWLLATWAYLRYVAQPGLRRYLMLAICFALGLMAKPMLVTLPLVLLLLDYWPLSRLSLPADGLPKSSRVANQKPLPGVSLGQLIWEKVPLFLLAGVSCLVTFYAQKAGGSVSSLEEIPLTVRLANALVAYVAYLGKALWPANLAVFYPHPVTGLPAWQVLGAALTLAAISTMAVWQARRRPYLLVGWLWYLITLVPVIGLVQVGSQAMADRYTYVPLLGPLVAAAWGLAELAAWTRRPAWVFSLAAGALLAVLTLGTMRQVSYWRDAVTLFEHALRVSGPSPVVHVHLGSALMTACKLAEAREHFYATLRLQPGHAAAHINLGMVFQAEGNMDQALAHYHEALRLCPTCPTAHYNLGVALFSQRNYEQTAFHFREALRLRPDHLQAHANLGIVLYLQGDVDQAITHYREALRLQPGEAEVHNNLGVALVARKELDQARRHYAEALRLKPDYADAHYNLGKALYLEGGHEEARLRYEKAIELNPEYPEALDGLARILATTGQKSLRQPDKAVDLARQANRLTDYRQPEFLDTLAAALAASGDFREAMDLSQKALALAQEAGNGQLTREIEERLHLYRQGHPFHTGAGP